MKRWMGLVALVLCMAVLYCGCAASSAQDNKVPAPATEEWTAQGAAEDLNYGIAGTTTDTASSQTAALKQDDIQKLIVTAQMDMTADDPQAAADALSKKAQELGGYVSSSSMQQDDLGVSQAQVMLRVAPEALEQLTQEAGTLGRVTSYNMDTQEITQEYWDVQARLKNAQAQEAQLLLLMQQATTIEDTLKVREALSDVQGEIESYQGQIKLWDNQVGYSTLNVWIDRSSSASVSGSEDRISMWRMSDVWTRMKNGFVTTGRFLVNAGYSILILLAYLAIPLLLMAVVAVIVILIVKARRGKRKNP